jgi:hypothetical protein
MRMTIRSLVISGWLVFGVLSLPTVGRTQVPLPPVVWAKSAGNPGPASGLCFFFFCPSSSTRGFGMAVDAAGNAYVTGSFVGPSTFGSTALTVDAEGSPNLFMTKYDTAGTLVWARSAGGGNGFVEGTSVAVDAAGNSYVAGGYDAGMTFGSTVLSPLCKMFVAKYGGSGNPLWATGSCLGDSESAGGIATDAEGNLYVTGSFGDDFSTVLRGVFIVKYNGNGNFLWATNILGYAQGQGIATDAAGNAYVTGSFTGLTKFETAARVPDGARFTATDSAAMATPGKTLTMSDSASDLFVAKYDPGGNLVWVRSAGGASDMSGQGIAMDSFGNAYVTGKVDGTVNFGGTALTPSQGDNVLLAKYDSSGNFLWATTSGGFTGSGVTTDGGGNAYVIGSLTAPFPPNTGPQQIFVAKYNRSGSLLWVTKQNGGQASAAAGGIATDPAGNAYVAGTFEGTVTFGGSTLSSGSSIDMFLVRDRQATIPSQ